MALTRFTLQDNQLNQFMFLKEKKFLCGIFLSLLLPFSFFAQHNELPSDKHATSETVNLYNNLRKLLMKGCMIGHQDDLAYGVNWKYENGRSDIKDVTGEFPAVFGWELGRIELDNLVNLDSVPFNNMKQYIRKGYEMGGVITISWHLNNPLTGKSAWDPAQGTVTSILPGGEKKSLYKSWLDKLSVFMNGLKDKNGKMIPVIFRPFHELNGSWFWWGKNHCTPDELKKLFQFTVSYLRDTKHLHHLLYAYNTDKFFSKEEYLERYPGDEWVDIIGFDIYQRGNDNKAFITSFDQMLSNLESISKEKNKIPALTEFGYGGVPDSSWWTQTFWAALKNHKISYALAWRNAGLKKSGEMEFYMPFTGQQSENDFRNFFMLPETLFINDVKKEKLYSAK